MINWSFLDYFAAAAREENFSKAASSLFYSQPYLSKRISALEEELGVPLFERRGKKVVLTAAGAHLYEQLQKINQQISALKGEIEQFRREQETTLPPVAVHADPYAQGLVTEILHQCRALYPEFRYELIPEVFTGQPPEQGIWCYYSTDHAASAEETLHLDQEKIYINKASPSAGKRRLRWADLAGHTCVTIRTVPRQVEWERETAPAHPEITFRHVNDVFEAMSILCSQPNAFEIWNSFSHESMPLYNTIGIPMDGLSALAFHIELRSVPKQEGEAFCKTAKAFCRSLV